MSLENTLHVLRMPVTVEDTAQVSTLDYALTIAFVALSGVAVILGMHRWLP